jgi:sensor domain CHASE-containing protein
MKDKILKFKIIPIIAILISLFLTHLYKLDYFRTMYSVAVINTEMTANDVAVYFETVFRDEFFILQYMASEWERRGSFAREEWDQAALEIVDEYGFQALEFVEGTHVRWIVPLEGNEAAINLDLSFEESRRLAIERATELDEVSIGGPMALVQGGTGLLIFAPIFIDGEREFFILGVIRTEAHLEQMLSKFQNCNLKIISAGEVLYQNSEFNGGTVRKVVVNGFEFNILVKCDPPHIEHSFIPWIILSFIIGLLTEILIISIIFRNKMHSAHNDFDKIIDQLKPRD